MVVTLIGYRGSGKSAVARPLAARLGWGWADADAAVEERAGRTIREIFASDGEAAFRALERREIEELLARDRLVIAAGGGAVLDADTRREMRERGPVVWLKADADVLEERIRSDASTAARRPDLIAGGVRREIETLLAVREPLYRECATLTIDSGQRSISEIIDTIVGSIPDLLDEGRHP